MHNVEFILNFPVSMLTLEFILDCPVSMPKVDSTLISLTAQHKVAMSTAMFKKPIPGIDAFTFVTSNTCRMAEGEKSPFPSQHNTT
jgi:hypothetical protein